MSRDSTVIRLRQPEAIDDPLSELAREGARRMLAQVLIAEADCFVAMWKALKLPDGRDRVVRHGHGPHRAIQTGLGPVEVRRAKVRDQGRTHMNSTEATNINVVRKYFAGCQSDDLEVLLSTLMPSQLRTSGRAAENKMALPGATGRTPSLGCERNAAKRRRARRVCQAQGEIAAAAAPHQIKISAEPSDALPMFYPCSRLPRIQRLVLH